MIKYQVVKDDLGSEMIERQNKDGTVSYIPLVDGNSDYQAYLRWLEDPEAEENGTIS